MPNIQNVKYPIIVNTTPDAVYTISYGGNVIFTGFSRLAQTNISFILQDYVNSQNITVSDENLPIIENNALIWQFTVNGSSVQTVYATNDYNCHWITEKTEDELVSDIIGDYVHPEQLIFVDALSPNGTGVINVGGTNYPVNNSTSVTVVQGSVFDFNVISYGNFGVAMLGIATNGTTDVAVGNNGVVYYRNNNGSWNLTNAGIIRFNTVAWGNGMFVAGGQSGVIWYSSDGASWTQATSPVSTSIQKIIFDGSRFVGVASMSTIIVSSNGVSWTSNGNAGIDATSLAYGNGIYSVVGYGGSYAYSSNLQNWQSGTVSGNQTITDVCFGNGIFIFVTDNGYCGVSADGYNWDFKNVTNYRFRQLSYGNGRFVAIGGTSSGGGSFVYLATRNGAFWSEYVDQNVSNGNAIAYNPNTDQFITAGAGWSNIELVEVAQSLELSFNGKRIEFMPSKGCERYAIYFVNKKGGRTTYLVQARRIVDGVSNDWFRIKTNYDRTSSRAFQTRTIRNEVTKTHQFNTGWISDEDNEKITDLVTSPKVWIHDFETGEIKSAFINQSNFEEKRYKNDRRSNSTITIYEAQDHIRR